MHKMIRSLAMKMLRQRQGADPAFCEICGVTEATVTLCVDHNHETGMLRGLLCNNCNAGIGLLGDSADRLEAAAKYLRADPSRERSVA